MLCVKLLQESISISSYDNNDIGGSNIFTHNHNCLMGTITFEVHHITLTSPINTLATILKAFWFFLIFMFFAYFTFKHILHGHIREKIKYPIMQAWTSLFCCASATPYQARLLWIAHRCFMIDEFQWWDGYLSISLRIF